ncbi:MAG TPA: SH3 domain-containing protein, partial [Rhodanobacteraceae bacterium]|nr:SH3 domain-containing protein [Rhodanobacteraceae bacterium]
MKRLPPLAVLPLALALPLAAQAQDAFVVADIPLRAGPAPEYPDITLLPNGAWVDVQGCIGGWEWCDVIVDGDRGWVPGGYIEYVYDSRPVPVVEYGPRIGIPIVSFSIVTYWDAHYRHRPFYRERDRWYHRRIVRVAPPPPPPRPPGGWKVPPRSHAPGGPHHVNPPNPPRAPVNPS